MNKSISSNIRRHIALLTIVLFSGQASSFAYANMPKDYTPETQQTAKKLTGVVVDTRGESIIGANVSILGTSIGTITDIDGNFSLDVSSNQTVVVSYIGYETKQIAITNQQTIKITLNEMTNMLDELVVVSYGTQKKREITGAISNIKADALTDLPVGQIAQKLQGQIAGVQITQSTGIPGQGMAFRIRGAASIGSSSQPLIVLDGLPISTGLNNINPDEIETFSVLKDAAATSLYGSRAANGVILITTKRGKQGTVEVNFHSSYGIQTLEGMKEQDIMNARDFAQFKKESYEDAIKWGHRNASQGVPEMYQNPEQYGEGTDWYKLLTRTGSTQTYSLTLSGSKDNFSSATTLGYFKQEGVIKNSKFERITLRSNNDYKVNDRIKIGLNLAPMLQIYDNQNTDGDRNILSGAMIADPCQTPYDKDGNLKISLQSADMFPQVNWLRAINERMDNYRVLTLLTNVFADVDIWNGIKYRFQFGTDIGGRRQRTWNPSTAAGSWIAAPPGIAEANYNTENYYNWNMENMFTYDKTIGKHNLSLLAGYSAQEYKWERSELKARTFPDDDIDWISAGITKSGTAKMTGWTVASYIARADYNYNNRYMLQFNIRRDGSSRFGAGNKYANFPSASAGWIASDESFMEPITNTMNYLKLRTSYGLTGNYNFGDYEHLAQILTSNYVFNGTVAPGKRPDRIGNSMLTWEETKQFNIGADFGFLKDRIFFMYDYYSRTTDGMLYQTDIPWSSGFNDIKGNIGSFRSWGHELTLESRNLTGTFQWKTNLNLTFNRNEVLKLSTNDAPIGGYGNSGRSRLQVGEPMGIMMGWVFDGVYMNKAEFDSQPKHATSKVGSVRYKDLNDDGVIDLNDRTKIGDPNPDMQFGITNEFKWKNFDLSVLVSGQLGGDIYAGTFENTLNLDGVFNVLNMVKDRWRSEENPGKGIIPSTEKGTTELSRYTNSLWVYDATHLTLRNVTVGYTVPFKNNPYFRSARFYLSAQQLFILCSYPGLNPEISSNNDLKWDGMGVDRTTYPIPRTFSIGCNITF